MLHIYHANREFSVNWGGEDREFGKMAALSFVEGAGTFLARVMDLPQAMARCVCDREGSRLAREPLRLPSYEDPCLVLQQIMYGGDG